VGGWWYGIGRFQDTPDVIGMTRAQAEQRIAHAGLSFKIAERAYSEVVPAGSVIASDPDPGDNVLKDGTVNVTLSIGPERHDVPDLKGMSEDEARSAIADANLSVGSVRAHYDNDMPEGTVISFSPKAGTPLKRDDPVNLVVSKGPTPVEVGDYTGQPAKPVVRELTAAGLTVNLDRHYDDNVEQGVVIAQNPTNVTLYAGDSIDLAVSRGPHLVEVPNVHLYGEDAAVQALEAVGFKVHKKKADVYYGLGFVVGQDPDGGTMLPFGDTVTIFVS
jgi:serine/threonine-protein kinase